MRFFAIDEILRYRGTRFPGSRTLCHPAFQAQLQIETKNIQVQLQIEMKNIRFATNCTPASGRVHFDIAKDAHRIETLYFIKGLP